MCRILNNKSQVININHFVNESINFNYFKGSKTCKLKDSVHLAINLRYSKFGGISPSVSRLLRYESVVKGIVPHVGQKVMLFSTNFWGY